MLGTGMRRGMKWTEIEVTNEASGQPMVRLAGKCRSIAEQKNLGQILVSISHIETHAVASAVAPGRR